MDKVVFGPSVEALWRAMQPMTPAELEAFRAAGVVDGRFDAAYALEPYMKILAACATSRYGHLPLEEAYIKVGHLFAEGFGRTMIGQALIGVMKLVGPRRTLQRMTRNFRAANNYTDVQLVTVEDNLHRIKVNYVAQPGFYMGIIQRTCENAGAKNVQVTMVDYVDQSPTFEVRWA